MRNIFINVTGVILLCIISALAGGAAVLTAVKADIPFNFSSGSQVIIYIAILSAVTAVCAVCALLIQRKKSAEQIKNLENSVRKAFEAKNPVLCSSPDEPLSHFAEFMRSYLASVFEESKSKEAGTVFFKRIIDSVPVGIYAKNLKEGSRFSLWNESMAAMFGVPSASALGRTEEEIRNDFPALPVFRTTDKDAEVMKSFVITKELELVSGSGNILFSVKGIPLFDEKGDVETVLGIVENKTADRKLEKELIAKTAQLEELNRNLEFAVRNEAEKRRKNEHLLFEQSKFTAMGQMINAIAHQWRQPINALGLYIQDFEDSFESGEMNTDYVKSMTESCMNLIVYLSKTIDDFRNFYATNEAKIRFNTVELVFESLGMVTAKAEYANIELTVTVNDSEPVAVYGHIKTDDCRNPVYETEGFPTEFKQVMLNIYHNAVEAISGNKGKEAAPRTGMIETVVSCGIDSIIVEVKDNGGGIPDDIMPDIFGPYFTTKEQGKGTGVGLYMCRTVIETNMNGKITARNENGGAVFTITLPR